jgi:plastocyanin
MDLEVLDSPSETGDDFRPVLLDRPAQLLPSVEPQWFQVVRPAPPGRLTPPQLAPPERERYAQQFPDVAPVRRLLVRVLSTHGDGEPGPQGPAPPSAGSGQALVARPGGVSLGEVAAYGPDLEVTVGDEITMAGELTGNYRYTPTEIRALAGRPVFVLFMNQSRVDAHTFVTVGQERNLELRAEPGQAVSGQFVAAGRPGRYEFLCRVITHDVRGLLGSIVVR